MHVLNLSASDIEKRLLTLPDHVVDQDYLATSTHPQSGISVHQAIAKEVGAIDANFGLKNYEVDGINYLVTAEANNEEIANKDTSFKPITPHNLEYAVKSVTKQAYDSLSDYPQSGKAVAEAVAGLVNSAPDTLDTLNELAEALGRDPNFATTMAAELGKKVDKEEGKGLSSNDFTDEYKAIVDDTVGKKAAVDNGEVFNDYLNNTALGKFSHVHGRENTVYTDNSFATGYGTKAGTLGWKIFKCTKINVNHLRFELQGDATSLQVGDTISFQISNCYDFAGTVTIVDAKSNSNTTNITFALDYRYNVDAVVNEWLNSACTIDGDYTWVGHGVESDPYLIRNVEDLNTLAAKVNSGKYYENEWFALTNDIILNNSHEDYLSWNENPPANIFTPIGSYPNSKYFRGNLEGRGYTIYGLYVSNNTAGLGVGLFGAVHTKMIRNLHIKNSYVSGYDIVGGLVGICQDARLVGCSFDGVVRSTSTNANGAAASGLVSQTTGTLLIDKCSVSGTIDGFGRGGSILGSLNGNYYVSIENSYSTAKVTGIGANTSTSSPTSGGLIGFVNTGKLYLYRSFFAGIAPAPRASGYSGPIINHYAGGTLNCINTYYDSNKNSVEEPTGHKFGTAKTSTEFKNGNVLALLNDGAINPVFEQGENYPVIEYRIYEPDIGYSTKYTTWTPSKPHLGEIALGNSAVAAGVSNIASQEGAVVTGKGNIVGGKYGFSSGKNNKVGYGGFAAGTDNSVLGVSGFSAGSQNIIDKNFGVAIGLGLHTKGEKEVALGYFNYNGYDDYNRIRLLSVGNGTGNDARRNAMTIYSDGSAELQKQGTTENSIVTNSKFKFCKDLKELENENGWAPGTIVFIYED